MTCCIIRARIEGSSSDSSAVPFSQTGAFRDLLPFAPARDCAARLV
jgi:hypothetical protein